MHESKFRRRRIYLQQEMSSSRYVNPEDISVPPGYRVEAFFQGIDTPIGLIFTEDGDLIVAESGYSTGNPRVLRINNNIVEVLAEGFSVPIYGINNKGRDIYVSHRGSISILKPDGSVNDIIKGLPSYGDYGNNRVTFSPDNKIISDRGPLRIAGL